MASNNYILEGITPEIAELSTKLLSELNPDLADRIICAAVIVNNKHLVTAVKNLRASRVIKTIW
jgi:PIN domain nuclease of toxin-antitoxin system